MNVIWKLAYKGDFEGHHFENHHQNGRILSEWQMEVAWIEPVNLNTVDARCKCSKRVRVIIIAFKMLRKDKM